MQCSNECKNGIDALVSWWYKAVEVDKDHVEK